MRSALGLARRALGVAWPNPAVGCVIVKDGAVTGRGWTQPGGRPHAETEALGRAGGGARGATAYVSLEPCAHEGETPPCADALVAAGLGRVVVGLGDPDPRVDGGGVARLRAAGIEVVTGVCADEAAEIAAGFVMRIARGRPLVTLKLATTLDGRIATRTGASQWITGETARRFAHGLRARHDAVLVGAGTAFADDPSLTCRLPGLERRAPVRVFVDGAKTLPVGHDLIAGAKARPTWLLAAKGSSAARRRQDYGGHGVDVVEVAADDGGVDLADGLGALARRGITRLLVEGGGGIAAALLRRGLVDRLVWFRAAKVIGGDGLAAVAPLGVEILDGAAKFQKISMRAAGADVMETYVRAEQAG